MAIKGIVLDKDGTIVDFKATFDPATRVVLEELCGGDFPLLKKAAHAIGYDLHGNTVLADSIIVAGSGEEIACALGSVLARADLEKFTAEVDERFGIACSRTVAEIPGAMNCLKTLSSQGYELAIATNDSAANAQTQLDCLEISDLFKMVLGADSGYGAKPGPGMIEAYLQESGFSPDEVLMVGDSTHDLEAGRDANVITCGVETGPATRETLAPHADHILGSIVELPDYISNAMR